MKAVLDLNSEIIHGSVSRAVKNAADILRRDIKKVFSEGSGNGVGIRLCEACGMGKEEFMIDVSGDISVYASGELGFVYGLLYISEKFLGIKPFWFWLDQQIAKKDRIEIEYGVYKSEKPAVKYRGWFINDEVLIMKWNVNGDSEEPWRMVFEALLRCGGNMVIPGTDKNSKKYSRLASDMGLWITHHHAEPLGAEMFVRAYPDTEPNYADHPEMFHKLWKDAVEAQKDMKVIWCLGFRGQGDCPFWSNDSSGRFDTPEKRGALISEIIELQRRIVEEKVKDPVLCTNLYGEIMELYDGGHIRIADDIIKISADNGYGKMVTRRRDNHTVRISSLPKSKINHGGIYYHASFYDLQAANHITMLPNSIDFVNRELSEVEEKNVVDYWLINCSNVRPHAYFLDAISKKWSGRDIEGKTQSEEFAAVYYGGSEGAAECLRTYADAMIAYGKNEDEHAGEQFYTENIRMIVNQYIRDKNSYSGKLIWLTGKVPLVEQTRIFCGMCAGGEEKLRSYYERCEAVSKSLSGHEKMLFDSIILMQAKIHYFCAKGVRMFGEAYEESEQENYLESFMKFGYSAETFDAAENAMRGSEYGVWKGFYFNDCFADIKHTAYMIKKLMGVIRELGDNARHDKWYREAVYEPEDRYVMTLLVNDNHMTDWDLFEVFKKKRGDK